MPHIPLSLDLPGIRGAMAFRPPETARPLNDLVEILLRGSGTLTPADAETHRRLRLQPQLHQYCHNIHGAIAAAPGQSATRALVKRPRADFMQAEISPKGSRRSLSLREKSSRMVSWSPRPMLQPRAKRARPRSGDSRHRPDRRGFCMYKPLCRWGSPLLSPPIQRFIESAASACGGTATVAVSKEYLATAFDGCCAVAAALKGTRRHPQCPIPRSAFPETPYRILPACPTPSISAGFAFRPETALPMRAAR